MVMLSSITGRFGTLAMVMVMVGRGGVMMVMVIATSHFDGITAVVVLVSSVMIGLARRVRGRWASVVMATAG